MVILKGGNPVHDIGLIGISRVHPGGEMKEYELPGVIVNTNEVPSRGENTYIPIPESIEFRRSDRTPGEISSLGMGRVVLALDSKTREMMGLQAYVRTARWKTEGVEPPPEPDAEGALIIKYPFGQEDFAYISVAPDYLYHEESRSLRIKLGEGMALAIRVADCLLAGIDSNGQLTDIWMLDLDIEV
jgi:hypothetical protein